MCSSYSGEYLSKIMTRTWRLPKSPNEREASEKRTVTRNRESYHHKKVQDKLLNDFLSLDGDGGVLLVALQELDLLVQLHIV